MFELSKFPHMLRKKVKEICRRYSVEATLGAFIEYIRENKSSEYDNEFADDMEKAYETYLDRRRKAKKIR